MSSANSLFDLPCSWARSFIKLFKCSIEVITTSIWLFFSAPFALTSCLNCLRASDCYCLFAWTSSVSSNRFLLKIDSDWSTKGLTCPSVSYRVCISLDYLAWSSSFWLKQCQSPSITLTRSSFSVSSRMESDLMSWRRSATYLKGFFLIYSDRTASCDPRFF